MNEKVKVRMSHRGYDCGVMTFESATKWMMFKMNADPDQWQFNKIEEPPKLQAGRGSE